MPHFLYLIRKKAVMITDGKKEFLRICEFTNLRIYEFMAFIVDMDISDFFC